MLLLETVLRPWFAWTSVTVWHLPGLTSARSWSGRITVSFWWIFSIVFRQQHFCFAFEHLWKCNLNERNVLSLRNQSKSVSNPSSFRLNQGQMRIIALQCKKAKNCTEILKQVIFFIFFFIKISSEKTNSKIKYNIWARTF